MELAKEILIQVLSKENVRVDFPGMTQELFEMMETEAYKTLEKIKAVIENDNLSDFDCVEEIVRIFESIGSHGGVRHDFG